jgi:hypothetical protein
MLERTFEVFRTLGFELPAIPGPSYAPAAG